MVILSIHSLPFPRALFASHTREVASFARFLPGFLNKT